METTVNRSCPTVLPVLSHRHLRVAEGVEDNVTEAAKEPDLTTQGALTRSEAAALCDVSQDTIKRRLRAGAFPNARQAGVDRHWVIPVLDLVAAGLLPAGVLKADPPQPSESLPPPDVRTQLGQALMEIRALREALARSEDEVAFLRSIVVRERVA